MAVKISYLFIWFSVYLRYNVNDVIYMYIYDKVMKWSCEKMINAYASIWRCLMHDIIIEIGEKACVHVHHLKISTQEETFVSHYTENI